MSVTIPYTSWGKGELSPFVRGHVDTTHYYSSAESLYNTIVRPYAVPVRRAGTKYVGLVKDSTKDTRLIEFVFSVTDSYIIEFGENYFRIKDSNGEPITYDLDGVAGWVDATPYVGGDVVLRVFGVAPFVRYWVCKKDHTSLNAENKPGFGTDWEEFWYEMEEAAGDTGIWDVEVTNPYAESDIWNIDYAQKNDVIKLTQNQYDIAELRRYDGNVWLFTQGVVEGPPWEEINEDIDNEIKSNGIEVGLLKSIQARPPFEPFTLSDVGRYFRLGALNSDGEQGYFKCTSFVDTQNLNGENLVKIVNDSYSSKWARNAFYTDPVTDVKNYPDHVTYHEGRLDLAGTPNESAKHWFSKSFIYNDFNVGDTVAFGFDMVANTAQANPIKWVSSSATLVTGTFGAEFSTESPSDAGLNNDNKNIREQSSWGSEFVRPVKIGTRLYYLQRTSRKIREYFYLRDLNNFQSNDMTEYSDHITISGVKDMHYQRNQDSLLWTVLENGQMAVLSRHPEQEIQAWTPWETDGDVKSIRFIPNPDGESDRGFIIVERTMAGVNNGDPVKYIEYFDNHVVEDDTLQTELYYVDSGFTANTFDDTDGIDLTLTADAFIPATIGVNIEDNGTTGIPYYIDETRNNDLTVTLVVGVTFTAHDADDTFLVGDIGRTLIWISPFSGLTTKTGIVTGYNPVGNILTIDQTSGILSLGNAGGGYWGFSTDTLSNDAIHRILTSPSYFTTADVGEYFIIINTDGDVIYKAEIVFYENSEQMVTAEPTIGSSFVSADGALWGFESDTLIPVNSCTAESAFFDSDMTDKKIKIVDSSGTQLGLFSLDTYFSTTIMSGTWDTAILPDQTITGGLWGVSVLDIDGTDYNINQLEGETVDLFFDGIDNGTGVVTSGVITNTTDWWIASVGLNFTCAIQTNPLNAQTPSGMAKGKIRRVHEIALDFYKTLGVEFSSVGGDDDADWFPVNVPEGVDPTVLFTGTVPNIPFEGKLDYDGYLYLRLTRPYSMNLLGIYARAEIAEGK